MNKKNLSGIILVFLFSFISSNDLIGQDWNYSYSKYTKDLGLPSNNVYCVISDKDGFLWIASDVGIIKFDGCHYKIFTVENGLPSNDVFEIYCDKKNRIWITTLKNDICYIKNDKICTIQNDTLLQKINVNTGFPRFFEDSKGNIWIYSNKNKIYLLSTNNSVEEIKINYKSNTNYFITEFKDYIYILYFFNTIKYDPIKKTSVVLKSKKDIRINGLGILNNKCYFINEDNNICVTDTSTLVNGTFKSRSSSWKVPIIDSDIWITSKNGFNLYDLKTLKLKEVILNGLFVSTTHKDLKGNLWISTLSNGIFKLNSKTIINLINLKGNIKNSFYSITVDKSEIFVGNYKGQVFIYNKKKLSLSEKIIIKKKSLTGYRILKIHIDNHKLQIVTDVGTFLYNRQTKYLTEIFSENRAPKNIYSSGDSLLETSNIGIRYLSLKNKEVIKSIIIGKRIYSYTKYLNRPIVGSEDILYSIDTTLIPYPLNIPFNYRAVDLLVKDSLLIATTAEKGIFFIRDHDVIKNINATNGFSSNTCYKSVLYKDALFTASKKGINIYDFKTDSIFHIFESDGLPSNTVYDLCIQNDTIYAATENGLSIIPIQSISHFKSFPLFIKPIYFNNDTLWEIPKNFIARTNATIELVLNGLSFDTKSNVNYFYRIKEMDTTYKSTIDQNIALQFPHIGQYTFEAYSENSEGTKSNKIIFTIHVIPYFYQTWWFKLCIAIIIFILLITVYKKLIIRAKQKEIKKAETENKIRNLEIAAWRSAINPHFLFNSLNTMQGLFSTSDFEKANTYVAEFSNMLRKTIDQSTRILVQIEVEIGYLKNFLELEKIKRDDNLQFNISLSNQPLEAYYIPSLMIQPIVENALKHGIQDRMDGMIWIQFEMKENRIFCTITDNGKGLGEENKSANQDSKGHLLIENKIRIVEKLIHHKIGFSFGNKYSAQNNIIGAEAIFSFPILTFDYDDTSNYRG